MVKGIVRKLDELGRITLPKEYRNTYGIKNGDPLGMFVEGNFICLVKPAGKFVGIVRNLDELGRYTLPIEVRRALGIETGQKVDIYVDPINDAICIRKEGCEWCDETEDLFVVGDHRLCRKCAHSVVDAVVGEE